MEVIKGRMYDYNNGRFLSVDPFIQSPTSTQSMNPYTYILNNPLSGTDPSGYRFKQGFSLNWQSSSFGSGNGVADFRSSVEDDNGLKVVIAAVLVANVISDLGTEDGIIKGVVIPAANDLAEDVGGVLNATDKVLVYLGVYQVADDFNNTFVYPLTDGIGAVGNYLSQYDGEMFTIASMGGLVGMEAYAAEYYSVRFLSSFSKFRGFISGSEEVSIGYHATLPEIAPLIRQNGFRQGTASGRLGSGGTYLNNTRQGAIAEFEFHNPGVTPSILKVEYTPGINASTKVAPKNYVERFPFNQVDSISAPSVRLPSTTNTNVLNDSLKILD